MENLNATRAPRPDLKEVWGIVGGMGPLASAAFLQTIYDLSAGAPEQAAPRIILLSDPAFPDRTECLLAGREDLLIGPLEASLEQLRMLGATHSVICCMTIHAVLPRMGDPGGVLLSLVDVMLSRILEAGQPSLMLSTNGVRTVKLFENHPRWRAVERHLVMPDQRDQAAIHELIYEVKSGRCTEGQESFLRGLQRQYGVHSLAAGCTEFHLISRAMARTLAANDVSWIDPLTEVAARIATGAWSARLSAA